MWLTGKKSGGGSENNVMKPVGCESCELNVVGMAIMDKTIGIITTNILPFFPL